MQYKLHLSRMFELRRVCLGSSANHDWLAKADGGTAPSSYDAVGGDALDSFGHFIAVDRPAACT